MICLHICIHNYSVKIVNEPLYSGFTLQRIGHSLGDNDIELQRFEEALHDSSSGLTYTELCGIHKQSVEDERLFSENLIK